MVHYRPFRNDDPPALVEVWNETFTSRGAVFLRGTMPLEYFVLAKPYFEPAGLIVAADEGKLVGFVHAGFGPNATQTGLETTQGVTCLLGVRPAYQGQGIGRELLRRSETYLRERGAKALFAGSMRPLNPFYFGLYGGSESPGYLISEKTAHPFLLRHGYQVADTCLVFHRALTGALNLVDARFAAVRKRFEVRVVLRTGVGTWWQESVLGPLEVLEFRLEDKQSGQSVARAGVWEMQGFSQRWNESAVGIVDVEVREDLRRQGLAKFLLTAILRQVQEQFFSLAEIQTMEKNKAAIGLYRTLGFEQVDLGRIYRKDEQTPV